MTITTAELPGTAVAGSALRFKMRVHNQGGFSSTSEGSLRVTLAGVPSQPAAGPVRDGEITSTDIVKIDFS
jgi:hypothetical protein